MVCAYDWKALRSPSHQPQLRFSLQEEQEWPSPAPLEIAAGFDAGIKFSYREQRAACWEIVALTLRQRCQRWKESCS